MNLRVLYSQMDNLLTFFAFYLHSLVHFRGRMIPEDLEEKIKLAKSQVNSPMLSKSSETSDI